MFLVILSSLLVYESCLCDHEAKYFGPLHLVTQVNGYEGTICKMPQLI